MMEVDEMKKVLIGGFLSLLGSIWALAIMFIAENHLVSTWTTPPGRFLTALAEMKLVLLFALAVLFVVLGIAIMAIEFFRKDK